MRLRAVTFDVYSALFDTVTGLTQVVAALFRARGISRDAAPVGRLWRHKHAEYLLVANSLEREPAANRRAIEASARYALRELAPPPTADELATLVSVWEALPPWPEAMAVLQGVRRRPLIVASLSNGDAGMQRALLATLPVTFDHVISTEGGRFKPHPSVYDTALRILGIGREELLHVAGSPTDAVGATAFGITTIWVNRTRDAVVDQRFAPAYDAKDLRDILSLIR